MVRNIILCIIAVLTISCNRNPRIPDTDVLAYNNFLNDVPFPFKFDTLPAIEPLDSFNIVQFRKYTKMRPFGEDINLYFEPKVYRIWDLPDDANPHVFEPGVLYYACGKIRIHDDVDSYLILRNKGQLMLVNVKNKRLKSLVFLTEYAIMYEHEIAEKSYLNRSDCSFLFISMSHLYGIDHYPGIDDFWSRIGLLKHIRPRYYYTSFTIDKNGYVKFIPFDENKFPCCP